VQASQICRTVLCSMPGWRLHNLCRRSARASGLVSVCAPEPCRNALLPTLCAWGTISVLCGLALNNSGSDACNSLCMGLTVLKAAVIWPISLLLTCRAAMLLRYTYNRVPSPLGESKEPTEAQMRIRELLMEKCQAAESRGAREGRQQ